MRKLTIKQKYLNQKRNGHKFSILYNNYTLVQCKALKESIQPKLKCKKINHNSTQGNHRRILNNLTVGRRRMIQTQSCK